MKILIIEMDCGPMYDIEGEVWPAIQSRLSRRILPRLTDNGYVEYGIQIPLSYTSRLPRSARLGGSTITGSKYGPEGSDIDWVMKGSGSISRGSVSSNTVPTVKVIPSSGRLATSSNNGQQFGSTLNLRRSDHNSDTSRPESLDSLNKHKPIPNIGYVQI